jgi:hypothetical protein
MKLKVGDYFLKVYKDGSKIIGKVTSYNPPDGGWEYLVDIFYSNTDFVLVGKDWSISENQETCPYQVLKKINEKEAWLYLI